MTEFCLRHNIAGQPLDIGAGIQIGEFSSFHSNFTAIGGVVNQATKAQSQARPGKKQKRLHLNPNVRIFIHENRGPYL